MSKIKEMEPFCLSCGKPIANHDGVTRTCAKVQMLRRAIRELLGCLYDSDQKPKGERTNMRIVSIVSGDKEHAIIDAARKALRETA